MLKALGPAVLLACALFLGCVLLAGCATPSTVLVNGQGRMVRCWASGTGVLGIATADALACGVCPGYEAGGLCAPAHGAREGRLG